MKITTDSVLIVVDIQNDFLPGGSLAVPEGDQILEGINALSFKFYNQSARVVFTQDWHPKLHGSFASAHPGTKPGDPIKDFGLGPILWPDHCVQNTIGAELSSKIDTRFGIAVVRKGYHQNIDSYSTFFENDKTTKTGLAGMLKDLGIKKVFLCGLALDYCVFYSAMVINKGI
jgi:nicotinamidase/pyrazinamidase